MANAGFVTWLCLRIARWVAWASFLIYSFRIFLNSAPYLDHFSRPLRTTEAWLYGLPLLAVTLGLLELMVRERAGIARPNSFRWTLKQPAGQANAPSGPARR